MAPVGLVQRRVQRAAGRTSARRTGGPPHEVGRIVFDIEDATAMTHNGRAEHVDADCVEVDERDVERYDQWPGTKPLNRMRRGSADSIRATRHETWIHTPNIELQPVRYARRVGSLTTARAST